MAFFVGDRLVRSRDPIWLQSALDILMTLFESINLRTNPDKTKVMTCVSGKIRVALTDEAYHAQQYGPADPTANCHWVECDICGETLAAVSFTSHLETQHNMYWSFVLNQDLAIEHVAVVYQASANATGSYFCPVPACVGVAGSKAALRLHFL